MPHGSCRLCGCNSELCHSHIFPEFFYKPNYDATHRYIAVSSHPRHRRPLPKQEGLREFLLCRDCEARVSNYETYAASVFRRLDEAFAQSPEQVEVDVDFVKFRLFGLSLIWRAHVSALHMFRQVDLGPHAEPIRQMLLAGDPAAPDDYAFCLVRVTGLQTEGRMIIGPAAHRFCGVVAYQFMALGYEWLYLASRGTTTIREQFPFVGCRPRLYVPTMPMDRGALFATIRRAFPESMRDPQR